jgi:hypothetical protein
MIIPVWVDPNKDRRLIDWLNSKTNKSASIREIIYSYIDRVDFKSVEVNVKPEVKEEKNNSNPFVKGFMSNINSFSSK